MPWLSASLYSLWLALYTLAAAGRGRKQTAAAARCERELLVMRARSAARCDGLADGCCVSCVAAFWLPVLLHKAACQVGLRPLTMTTTPAGPEAWACGW